MYRQTLLNMDKNMVMQRRADTQLLTSPDAIIWQLSTTRKTSKNKFTPLQELTY